MGGAHVYESTRDGVTRQSATPGSAADRRFAKSRRWRLVEAGPATDLDAVEAAARESVEAVEPGTFGAPRCEACPHVAHGPECEPCELSGEPCEPRVADHEPEIEEG